MTAFIFFWAVLEALSLTSLIGSTQRDALYARALGREVFRPALFFLVAGSAFFASLSLLSFWFSAVFLLATVGTGYFFYRRLIVFRRPDLEASGT